MTHSDHLQPGQDSRQDSHYDPNQALANQALYDLDRTITRHATFTPWLWFAMLRLHPWRAILFPLWFLLMPAYVVKLLNRKQLKQLGFWLMIGARIKQERLDLIAKDYATQTIATNVFALALAQIERDKAAGYHLVLVTASPDYYAVHIGKSLGFEQIIATKQRMIGDCYSHKISGANCYGRAKVARIKAEIAPLIASHLNAAILPSISYSDSSSDAPMMELTAKTFATNPSRKMRKLALMRGWEILDWS